MANYYLDKTGVTDYTTRIYPTPGIPTIGTGDASFAFWFKNTAGKRSVPFNWTGNNGVKVTVSLADGVGVYIISTTPSLVQHNFLFSYTPDEEWHHLAVTLTRGLATGLKIYLDGALYAEDDITEFDGLTLSSSTIVYFLYNASSQYTALDDFRYYQGTVLSLPQIQTIYNDGAGSKVVENDFAVISQNGWYANFDDGAGTTFSGRKIISGVWSDEDGSVGQASWQEGGTPLEVDPEPEVAAVIFDYE